MATMVTPGMAAARTGPSTSKGVAGVRPQAPRAGFGNMTPVNADPYVNRNPYGGSNSGGTLAPRANPNPYYTAPNMGNPTAQSTAQGVPFRQTVGALQSTFQPSAAQPPPGFNPATGISGMATPPVSDRVNTWNWQDMVRSEQMPNAPLVPRSEGVSPRVGMQPMASTPPPGSIWGLRTQPWGQNPPPAPHASQAMLADQMRRQSALARSLNPSTPNIPMPPAPAPAPVPVQQPWTPVNIHDLSR